MVRVTKREFERNAGKYLKEEKVILTAYGKDVLEVSVRQIDGKIIDVSDTKEESLVNVSDKVKELEKVENKSEKVKVLQEMMNKVKAETPKIILSGVPCFVCKSLGGEMVRKQGKVVHEDCYEAQMKREFYLVEG